MQTEGIKMAIVVVFIILDFVSGIAKSVKDKDFTSERMREGLYHKCAEVFAVIVTYFMQYSLPRIGLAVDFPLTTVIVTYVVIMEIGSIIENIGQINPQLVGPLSEIFEKIGGTQNEQSGGKRD